MNRVFNIIWSKSKERWIVVSEKVKTNGGVPKSRLKSLAVLIALFASAERAYALDPGSLPSGGVITSGEGTITTSGTQLTVNQSTPQMIANWQSFNIGANAGVRFNQPNSSSAVLNRISDQNPTQIMGSLSANGRVFLLNPSGIIFGSTARVDVGGLVASSLNMLDSDFLSGRYRFSNSGSAGQVINQGAITAMPGGVVALIAPKVTNEGSVTAPGGNVALAAGNQVSLDFHGDGLITLTVDQGAVDALAENKGLIKADGGRVIMTAKAADALVQSVVNNSGIIEARSLQARGGRIILDAEGGMTMIAGKVDASSPDGKGGSVIATGDRVLVKAGAHLTASGATGGGEVLVGGSWQNSASSVRQATGTIVEPGALLEASAIDTGNGGTVVAWSDVTNPDSVTRAYGTFEAKGGANSGDGGRIETSGHWLDVEGSKGGASALNGSSGLWLFDPYNVTIAGSADAGGGWGGANPNIWTPNASGSTILSTGQLLTSLNAGTSVTVTTTGGGSEDGNITVSSAITKSTNTGTPTLTLTAANNILLNANIGTSSSSYTLNLTMNAGGTISGNGNISGKGTTTFNVGSGSGEYSGAISDITGSTRSVTKSGTGTLILSGVSSYQGTTTVSNGVIKLGSSGNDANSPLGKTAGNTAVISGATLDLNGYTLVLPEPLTIAGTGYSGAGALTNTAVSVGGGSSTTTYSGPITVNSPASILVNTANAQITLSGTVNSTAILTFGGSVAGCTLSGVYSNTGNCVKDGTGTWTLSGNNTYSGSTTISAGTLIVSNSTGLGSSNQGTTVSATGTLNINNVAISNEDLSLIGTLITTGTASWGGTTKGTITLGAGTPTFGGTGTLTVSKAIAGSSRTLTKIDSGTLILSAANSYTGLTTVSGGTLQYGINNALSSGGVTVNGSGVVFDIGGYSDTIGAVTLTNGSITGTTGVLTGTSYLINNDSGTTTVSAILGGTNKALTKSGAGTVTLSGVNTYTGATTISNGTLTLDATGSIAASSGVANSGSFTIGGNKVIDSLTGAGSTALDSYILTIGDSDNTSGTYSGVLSGTGGITKAGSGTLTLSGTNTYTGGTTVSDGTLSIGSGGASGSISDTGTLSNSGAVVFNRSDDFSYGGKISGAGSLTKSGNGTLTLSGTTSDYSGAVTVSGGTLKLGHSSALGTTGGGVTVSDTATLDLNGISIGDEALTLNGLGVGTNGALINSSGTAVTYGGLLTLGSASSIVSGNGNIILSNTGTITGSGFGLTLGGTASGSSIASIVGTGTGTLTKSGTGTWSLSGANTYSGGTTVSTGTLSIGAGGASGSISDTGTLSNSGAVVFNRSNDFTYGGKISGAGSLTKSGNGTLTLSGTTSDYSGSVTVSAGTLKLGHSSVLGTTAGGVTVSDTATLDLNGISIGDEALTLNGLGVGTNGALINSSGTAATYGGLLTLGSASSIVSGNGNIILSNTGTITGSGFGLTLGGTASGSSIASIVGTGTGTLTKSGTGTWSLSGANTYSGGTTVSTGTLSIGAGGASGSISDTGTLSNSGAVVFNRSNDFTYGGKISGAGSLTKSGNGTLTLSGTTSDYSGSVTVSAGTLKLGHSSAMGTIAGGVTVSDTATLDLNGISIGDEALTLNGLGVGGTAGALTNSSTTASTYGGLITLASGSRIVSNSGTALTLSGTINGGYALGINGSGSVTLGGTIGNSTPLASFTGDSATSLFINGGSVKTTGVHSYSGATTFGAGAGTTLTTTNSSISGSGVVTATAGAVTFVAGSGTVTFNNTSNNFSSVTVTSAGAVSLIDTNALTISGIAASGTVDVATLSGDLTVSGNLSTTDGSATAIRVNAGKSAAAGTSTGGNIIVSGTPVITLGTGGIASFYTGSISGSTGLSAFIGTGTGRFRYNSDESASNYTTVLAAGKNAIYREQPTVTVTAVNETITYGTTPTLDYTISGEQNSDTKAQALSGGLSVSGSTSSSGKYTAGTHTIGQSGLTSLLGYGISYVSKTLTVDQKQLQVTAIGDGSSTYGNSLVYGAVTDNRITGDVVDVTRTLVNASLSTSSNTKVGSYKQKASGITGTDSANYSWGGDFTTTTENYAISRANLTVSGLSVSNKVYDATTTATLSGTARVTPIGSDVVTLGGTPSGAFADKNVGAGKAVSVTGNTISGTDAANYNLQQQSALSAEITRANLTVIGLSASNKVYDATTTATLTGTARVTPLGSDVVTVGGTPAGTFADRNVGTEKSVTVTGSTISGRDASNYTLLQQSALSAEISRANLTVSGLSASNKVYDATTTATLTGTAKVTPLGSDVVTLGGTPAGTFADRNVGKGKSVTVTGSTISGADAANYNLQQQSGLTADISEAPVTETESTTASETILPIIKATPASPAGATVSSLMPANPITTTAPASSASITVAPLTVTNTQAVAPVGSSIELAPVMNLDNLSDMKSGDVSSTVAMTTGGGMTSDISQASLPVTGSSPGSDTQAPFTGVINVFLGGKLVRQTVNTVIPLPDEIKTGLTQGVGGERVTLLNGSPLPSWLSYNSGARTFKILNPPGETFHIKVRVQDQSRSWVVDIASNKSST
ncbi:MAG: filamentous hemagglutinin N-terminal domain-containing protein [Chlorobiaceae bacterium]|nr:filamentous hemagglutinin N-terminal domain-containing protein [Chlorobiaceae bacterium]